MLMFWLLVLSACHIAAGEFLLPGDIRPMHYDVQVVYNIDPNSFIFYGVVHIQLKAVKPTNKIVLHAQDFSILDKKITLVGASDFLVISRFSLIERAFVILELQTGLVENENYTLSMPFHGRVESIPDGAYFTSYFEKNNTEQYLIATNFHPISASRAFPCFDEPQYKATFKLTIGHQKGYKAVSNMPLSKSNEDMTLEPYWSWDVLGATFNKSLSGHEFIYDQFEKSPSISTYMVAFVISKLAHEESPRGLSTTRVNTWARADALNQTEYASIITPKLVAKLEDWFRVDYALNKLELFAIPNGQLEGTESWGVITLRESKLLYDSDQSSFLQREVVAKTLSHEVAKQWYGNLVTITWWSDFWVKECFAQFVGLLMVAELEPIWHGAVAYPAENVLAVLNQDSWESSEPMSVPVTPKDIADNYNAIFCGKGTALFRMISKVMGIDVFKEALQKFLLKYSYSNAEQDDLWQQLTETSEARKAVGLNVTIKHIMESWTTQAGYPLVTVERNYSSNVVKIVQKRYLSLDSQSPSRAMWLIPLSVLCRRDGPPPPTIQWLSDGPTAVPHFSHAATPEDWLMLNFDMLAPYRVNYDTRNWMLLVNELKGSQYTSIPILGRVQLLSDALELAWSNWLDYNIALELATYLQHEREYLPLETGLKALRRMEKMFKRDPKFGVFQAYIRRIIEDTYMDAGGMSTKEILNNDDLNRVKIQILTSDWACHVNVPGCEENAIELFQKWMSTKNPDVHNPIPVDLRPTVYCVGVSRGSVLHWQYLSQRKENSNVAAAREIMLHALTCTRDVWLLQQCLEWTVTEGSGVRNQQAVTVILDVLKNTMGFHVAKDFIHDRIAEIYHVASIQGPALGQILQALCEQFTTEHELQEFLAWRDGNRQHLAECKQEVEQAVEMARVNIQWLRNNRKAVLEKLMELGAGYENIIAIRQDIPKIEMHLNLPLDDKGITTSCYNLLLLCLLCFVGVTR